MSNTFKTIAYHKNGAVTAHRNVMLQAFFISHDKPDRELWLGDGIYFWKRMKDAEWWPGQYDDEIILSATLSCINDQFVNLDRDEEWEAFQEFCEKTKEQMNLTEGYSFEFSKGKYQVNSFFYNVFKETYGILLLKYSFPERNNKPQYCATNNDIVSDIKIAARVLDNRWEWC